MRFPLLLLQLYHSVPSRVGRPAIGNQHQGITKRIVVHTPCLVRVVVLSFHVIQQQPPPLRVEASKDGVFEANGFTGYDGGGTRMDDDIRSTIYNENE